MVCKNLSFRQNWFLSTLEQFVVCRSDNQDRVLTFHELYGGRNITKKRVDEVRLTVLPRLPLNVFHNGPCYCDITREFYRFNVSIVPSQSEKVSFVLDFPKENVSLHK